MIVTRLGLVLWVEMCRSIVLAWRRYLSLVRCRGSTGLLRFRRLVVVWWRLVPPMMRMLFVVSQLFRKMVISRLTLVS